PATNPRYPRRPEEPERSSYRVLGFLGPFGYLGFVAGRRGRGMTPPTLRGEKVTLRAPRDDDLDFAMRFANDGDLRGWLRFWRPTTVDEERVWNRSAQQSDEPQWFVEHADRPVGAVSLTSRDS